MVELNKIEKRVIVLVVAALLAVVFVRWRQAEAARVTLTVQPAPADGTTADGALAGSFK